MSREILILFRSSAVFINAAYAVLLVVLAVLPRSISQAGFGMSDLAAHAIAYGVQGCLLMWAIRPILGVKRGVLMAVIGTMLFGLITETVQSILPYRDFGINDLGADGIGAMIGVGIALAFGFGGKNGVRQH